MRKAFLEAGTVNSQWYFGSLPDHKFKHLKWFQGWGENGHSHSILLILEQQRENVLLRVWGGVGLNCILSFAIVVGGVYYCYCLSYAKAIMVCEGHREFTNTGNLQGLGVNGMNC